MKRILLYLTAFLTPFLLANCSDDDDTLQVFAGIDNHIVYFSLTATDGTKWVASITGGEIVVTVPSYLSLEGAAVEYEISEQASLYPLPESITDWDDEQRFRVVAYNETLRDYTYKVVRSDVDSGGTVTLLTQSDVDEFAATLATVVTGNLIIGGYTLQQDDPVTDLSPLSDITEVRYNIVVNNSFAGQEVRLDGLLSAGGLYMGTSTSKVGTVQKTDIVLPALTTLGNISVNSDSIKSLQLPALNEVTNVYIQAKMLESIDLSALTLISGDMSLFAGTTSATGNSVLESLFLPSLESIEGSLEMKYLTGVTSLDLTALQNIGGSCDLEFLTSLKTLLLPELTHMGDAFTWKYLTNVTTLSMDKLTEAKSISVSDNASTAMLAGVFFPVLERVEGDFVLNANCSTSLLSLPALKSIGGQFALWYFRYLTDLEIPLLTECGSIYFYYLTSMADLDISTIESVSSAQFIAMYELATVKAKEGALNDVTLNGGSTLSVIPTFEGVETIAGTLYLTNYTKNGEFTFPGLKHIGEFKQASSLSGSTLTFPDLETLDTLTLTSCSWLQQFSAPKLAEVTYWNTSYTTLMNTGDFSIPSLRKIETFKFFGGTSTSLAGRVVLTSLDDFSGVTQIGSVDIENWGTLTDFSGLKNALSTLSESTWTVSGNAYNPTFQDMLDGKYVQQ
ncbi:MAG: hypothetical protein LUC23_05855 [Prevotellaceae bacterium]|nr:hypothetical protein [Prevotellaceae bacterium]